MTQETPSPCEPAPCTVWWADLTALTPEHLDVLDPHERRRRAAFANDADRDRFTLGAVLLRFAAGAALGTVPESVVVERSCPTCDGRHGRPHVSGGRTATGPGAGPMPDGQRLHVSVAHAGTVVAVATTEAGPVGVDVEVVRELDFEPLLRRTHGPGETRPGSAWEFLTTWVRKESLVKADGTGLATDLRALGVGPATEPARVVSWRGGPSPVQMRDLTQPTALGAVGCVSVLTSRALSLVEKAARPLLAGSTLD